MLEPVHNKVNSKFSGCPSGQGADGGARTLTEGYLQTSGTMALSIKNDVYKSAISDWRKFFSRKISLEPL
ncbi:hypothetical protein PoB_003269200 [Plakobranchus ocellatus]|uniref:Uncharacterized protein n=1 Tax=Plakobranchus ocellatus TaxID=259542 RepID=A0AAV4AG08_9GAST|nr:hypothetical protein PoB_003269200 [Plakobranchus ocellatus]